MRRKVTMLSRMPNSDCRACHGMGAIRMTVHTGLSNFDYIELKDNIRPGEVVITSDMSEFKNVQEIIIRN